MTNPTFQVEEVGPKEAEAFLSMNVKNRALNERAVAEYAYSMTSGTWSFDGAPIRLSKEGIILDGQHRLSAVVKSGTTQKFLVVYGVDPAAQMTMDTGRKRSLSNALTILGEKDTTQLAALLQLAYRWDQGVRGAQLLSVGGLGSGEMNVSPQIPQFLKYLEENPTVRESVQPSLSLSRKMPVAPRVVGMFHMLAGRVDADDRDFFLEKLASGENLSAGDPILVLRNRLIDMQNEFKLRKVKVSPEVSLAFFIKAWNSYRDGTTMQRLLYKRGGAAPDKFPEPR